MSTRKKYSSNIVRRPQNLNQSSTVFDITLMQSAKLIQDFAASSEYLNSDIWRKNYLFGTVRLFRILDAFLLKRSEIKNLTLPRLGFKPQGRGKHRQENLTSQ